jgi:hypothetical protein
MKNLKIKACPEAVHGTARPEARKNSSALMFLCFTIEPVMNVCFSFLYELSFILCVATHELFMRTKSSGTLQN